MGNLDERSDELDKQMEKHPAEESIEVLTKDAHRRTRQLRILAVCIVFNLLLTVGFGLLTYKTNQLARLAQKAKDAIVANCEVANDSRENNHALWDYILALPPSEPRTAEQEKRISEFETFIDRTFAQRDCQAEINK
jgi:hypothetical protein